MVGPSDAGWRWLTSRATRERERLVRMMPPVFGFELISHGTKQSSEEGNQWQ